jgi:hypothetical protein
MADRIAKLEWPPRRDQAVWSGPALAKHLKASVREVWQVPLHWTQHCLCLGRRLQYTPFLWSQSTDRAVR